MKKKSLFLLGSIVAFSALVGGTFAYWAISDNADPFSIQVSTGAIQSTTDQSKAITLSWGQKHSMANIDKLQKGVTRKAGVLDLRATTDDTSDKVVDGLLSYEVSGTQLLKERTIIDIFAGNLSVEQAYPAQNAPTPLGDWTTSGNTVSKNLVLTRNVANEYSVFVRLDNNTTAQELDILGSTAQIQITFNLNPGQAIEADKTNSHIYYVNGINLSEGQRLTAYAWKSDTEKNAVWPGVTMTVVPNRDDTVYTATISDMYTNVIFAIINNSDGSVAAQTADITIKDENTFGTSYGNNLFTASVNAGVITGTYGTLTAQQIYKVVGDGEGMGAWNPASSTVIMTAEAEAGYYKATVNFAAGETKFKVVETSANRWFSNSETWSECGFTLDSDGNVVVNFAQATTKVVHVNINDAQGHHVWLTNN